MIKVRNALTLLKTGQLDLEHFYKLVTEVVTKEVGCTRASIWAFNAAADRVECLDLFDVRKRDHEKAPVLTEEDYPEFFAAVKNGATVRAPRAGEHPDTKCFDELYFAPNKIFSMLNVGIVSRSLRVGVITCEHCGEYKEWSDEHVKFLQDVSFALGFAMGISHRKDSGSTSNAA